MFAVNNNKTNKMKKITLLLMLVVTSVSFAQLKKVEVTKWEEIGKVGPFGLPKYIDCKKAGDIYTFEYKDMKYPSIDEYKSFSFVNVDNTFEDLYATINNGFETMPKEDITLELPDYLLTLQFTKAIGMNSVTIYSSPKTTNLVGKSVAFTKRQIDKLFGKKK
jgi:hypothetical protein